MGNLGEGLYEVAWDEAWDASKNETIMNMHAEGCTDELIAKVVKKDKQEVNAIIKRMSVATV